MDKLLYLFIHNIFIYSDLKLLITSQYIPTVQGYYKNYVHKITDNFKLEFVK